jgi:hypothetical protein
MKKVDFKLPPIAVKIKTLLQPQKKSSPVPMFNQPLPSGCPHHRMSRILFAVSLSLLIAVAIPVITLKAITYSFLDMNQDTGFIFETTEEDGGAGMKIVMAALPRMLFLTPAKIALVAAVLSIFSAMAHLGFVVVDWKDGKRVRIVLRLKVFILTNCLLDASLGFSSQHHVCAHNEQHLGPVRPGFYIRYAQVIFTFP